MIATSWGIDRPQHKMSFGARGVNAVDCECDGGVGFAGTKVTRRPDPRTAKQEDRAGTPKGSAMIPQVAWKSNARTPAAHLLFVCLWDYAHDWRPGDGEWFVWPRVETLAARLGLTTGAIYAGLRTLRAAGWIAEEHHEGRRGWRLMLEPGAVELAPEECSAPAPAIDETQLGFAWPEADVEPAANDDAPPVAAPACAPPVDNLPAARSRCEAIETRELRSVKKPPPLEQESNTNTAGQDSLRVFRAYEAHRVATLDGPPARTLPPPGLLTLWRELGGNAKAWKVVEAYGRRAIDIVAGMRDRGDPGWEQRERWRRDGGEWSRARYDAVMAYQGAAAEPQKPSAPPPPDPVVDGERVTLLEREAWDAGGEAAVRKQRSEALSSERLGELAGGFLAKLRGVG